MTKYDRDRLINLLKDSIKKHNEATELLDNVTGRKVGFMCRNVVNRYLEKEIKFINDCYEKLSNKIIPFHKRRNHD